MVGSLGKQPATEDRRDITFKALVEASAELGIAFPKVPPTFGHGGIYKDGNVVRKDWMMLANGPDPTAPVEARDGLGCCVWSCAGHTTMEAAKIAGRSVVITGKETVQDYIDGAGYVLGRPETDNGTNMRSANGYRQRTGILDAAGNRHKIGAYVSIEPGNWEQMEQACFVFSAVEIGFEFQAAQYDQFNTTGVWDFVPGSPIEGGHAIPIFGQNSKHGGGAVSWERHLWITKSFLSNLNDETWAYVYLDELRNGKNERGYDLAALNALLGQLH